MKKMITKMGKRLVVGLMMYLAVVGSGKIWGQEVTLTANTSNSASGLYGLATSSGPVTYTNGSGDQQITIQTIAATINQKNLTPTTGCFGTSKIYLISSASGGQIKISLPSAGDYYLDKIEMLLSSNNTGSNLSAANSNGLYKWIQSNGTTYSSAGYIGGLTGYDQYTTICSNPVTFTAVDGSKSFVFGRGTIDGTTLSGSEFRIWQIKVWIKQVISCTYPDSKTVSGTTSICSGSSANVTLTSAQAGVGYDLYKNGTKVNGTSQTGDGNDLTWSVSEAGTYTVKTNSTGGYCDGVAMSGSAVITVNALPTPTFTSAPSTSARYTNVTYSTQSGQSNYIWNISGDLDTDYSIVSGGTSSDNSVTLQWLTAGTKTVSVNYQNSGGCTATSATQTTTEVSTNLASPTLTAAVNASVDAPFDITFSDDSAWRSAITDVKIDDVSLSPSSYSLSAGVLTLTPANDTKLQTPGSKSVKVIATGYIDATVSQNLSAGVVTQWEITTQPVAPTKNQGTLATQPVITFKDQYNNVTGNGMVTASASSGWILGGTKTINASSGIASFSGLTAGTADYSALSGATIVFSTSGLSDLTSSAFDIPAYSSSSTDYFRTKTTGNWNDAATWESSPDNSNWFDATTYPDANANTTTLLHNVTYNGTPATVGNVTVNSGVTLTNTTTAITVAAGKTLTVASGGFFDNQINSVTINAGTGGAIQVNGTYKVTNTTGLSTVLAFTGVTFASGSTLYIGGTGAPRIPSSVEGNVEWASSGGGSFLNSSSNTIKGNLIVSNGTGINNGSGGSARSLLINGNLILSGGQYNPLGKPGSGTTAMSTTVNGNVYLSGSGKLYGAQPGAGAGAGTLNIKGNIYIQDPSTAVVLSGGAALKGILNLNGSTQQSFNIDPVVTSNQYYIDSLNISNTNNVILNSDLTLNNLTLTTGNIIPGNYKLTLLGSVSGSGSIDNSGTPVVEYSGTSAQTISNIEGNSINQLLINNIAGVTINADLTANTVTVNPGSKLTIADGKTLTVSDNTLKLLSSESGGTATVLGSVSGNAEVEQNLSAVRNWYMSSPVAVGKMPAAGHWYNETLATNNWEPVSANADMTVGRGYIVVPGATGNVSFTGALNNGDQSIALTRTNANASYKGFNLVGNPYPSFLNATTLLSANSTKVEGNIWYRTHTRSTYQFQTYNSISDVNVPKSSNGTYIPPMQGFWIRALSSLNTLPLEDRKLDFNNDMRRHNDSTEIIRLRAPKATAAERQLIRLQVSNAGLTDELVLYSDANASNAYDAYDAPKMMNTSNSSPAINLYTTVGSENLVIDGRNSLPLDVVIPVTFTTNAYASGSYSISANELTNLPSGVTVRIIDNGVETSLSDGGSYTFTADAGTTKTFGLILRSPGTVTGVENGKAENFSVYANNNGQLVIMAPVKSTYAVYNAVGQLIQNGKLNSEHETLNTKLSSGVYVVKTENHSTRVIVK